MFRTEHYLAHSSCVDNNRDCSYRNCKQYMNTYMRWKLQRFLNCATKMLECVKCHTMHYYILVGVELFKWNVCFLGSIQQVSTSMISICMYSHFFLRTSNSVWSSSGVFTDTVNDLGEVKCRTTHLTSFAVLVDPAVGHAFMCDRHVLIKYAIAACYTCIIC